MKDFVKYLKDYFRAIPRKDFLLISCLVAILVTLNYTLRIERNFKVIHPWYFGLALFYLLYLCVLGTSYFIHFPALRESGLPGRKEFLTILLVSPLFFALKMITWDLGPVTGILWDEPWSAYLALILQWPLRLLLLLAMLRFLWNRQADGRSFFGLSLQGFRPQPYLMLLLAMAPVIAMASARPEFLQVYPKLRAIGLIHPEAKPLWPWKILFEISYGIDFISIELFFRGLLVIGMVRLAGIRAILPMAAFYCSVHFGKPIGECISSYLGGIVLGVIAYRTRTITGGLLVHLGIAWMMELGGYLGNLYINSR